MPKTKMFYLSPFLGQALWAGPQQLQCILSVGGQVGGQVDSWSEKNVKNSSLVTNRAREV